MDSIKCRNEGKIGKKFPFGGKFLGFRQQKQILGEPSRRAQYTKKSDLRKKKWKTEKKVGIQNAILKEILENGML